MPDTYEPHFILHVGIQVFSDHLLRRAVFSPMYASGSSLPSQSVCLDCLFETGSRYVVLTDLELCRPSCPLQSACPCTQSAGIKGVEPSSLQPHFPVNFRIFFSSIEKNVIGIFIRIAQIYRLLSEI